MSSRYLKYEDSGHCDLAPIHHFVPVFDNGGKVGIFCIYCEYVLFEHVSNTHVTPSGELIEIVHSEGAAMMSKPTDAVFVGWQRTSLGEPFPLYNITAADHPSRGSTVTHETLQKMSLHIPQTSSSPPRMMQVENMLVRFWKKIAF